MTSPIVSTNLRLRSPELLTVGEGSIVDDFSYISSRVVVGRYSHIASGCSIAGGPDVQFTLGDFSSVSSGVRIWCGSDDFRRDLVTIIPRGFPAIKENFIHGDVTMQRLTAVGANSVVMPCNEIPEGTVIGALSYVPPSFAFEAWSVYAGTPVRRVGTRDRDSVMRQLERFEMHLEQSRR